jgi:hypothetical protein
MHLSNAKNKYGLNMRQELHVAEFLRSGSGTGIRKHIRLQLIRDYTKALASIDFISVTNVILDKRTHPAGNSVFEKAWKVLFQRFENTLNHKNFPFSPNKSDLGLVFCDDTDGRALNKLIRKMSRYNPIPSSQGDRYFNKTIQFVIEEPSMRDSQSSLPIQAADLCAFLLYQKYKPNKLIRTKTGHGYFHYLEPILNKNACNKNTLGIVEL